MDRRFLTVLGVSLVFALVVSSVFYQMTSRGGSGPRAESTNQKDIVVATRPLSVGVMVKPADVKIIKVAAEAFPKGAFGKVEDVLDRPVISNVLLDEPILEGRLAAKGSGLGLAPTIPVGMRAVTVRVNDVAGVAGFVLPGMHVDVLVTGHPPNDSGDMTTTCLQNMLVLSAGQVMQAGRSRASHAVADGDAAGDSGSGRDADPGGQRRKDSTGAAQFERPDHREDLGPRGDRAVQRTSFAGARPSRRCRKNCSSSRGPRPRPVRAPLPPPPVRVAVAAPPPPAPAPPDQIIMIRGTQRTVETLPADGAKN